MNTSGSESILVHLVKLLAIAQLDRHPYNRDLEHSIMLGGERVEYGYAMLNQGSRAGWEDQTCSRWKPVFETQLMVAGGRSWGFVKQLFAICRRGSLRTQSLWTNIFCNHDLITCAQTVRLGLHRLKQVFQMEEVRQRFMFMARVSKKWEWSEILSH